MPVKHQKKPAPKASAAVEVHRKHADEYLAKTTKEKPEGYDGGRSEEAKP